MAHFKYNYLDRFVSQRRAQESDMKCRLPRRDMEKKLIFLDREQVKVCVLLFKPTQGILAIIGFAIL